MRTFITLFLALISCSPLARAQGQVSSVYPLPPATKLESIETNIATVIIKGTTEIGTVSVSTGVVAVRCREITDAGSGHKEQGISISITQTGQSRDSLLIDYDEINPLLNAIDYLNKIQFSDVALDSFDASFTTKGGFRFAALGKQRTGAIQFAIRDARTNLAPVMFSRDDMARFASLIDQAKKKLDTLR